MTLGLFAGLRYPIRGARFVYREHPSLVRYWAVPVVLTAVALSVSLWAAVEYAPQLADAMFKAPAGEGFWAGALRALHGGLRWLLSLVLGGLALLLCTALSGILAAPFNDALSAAVERIVTGQAPTSSGARAFFGDVGRTLRLEVVKFLTYAGVMLPMFGLSFLLPGGGQLIYSAFAFLFSIAYLALDYTDWPAARRAWPVRRRLGAMGGHPGTYLGFGIGVWVLLFVPLVNLLFMPAAVAGGTLMFLDVFGKTLEIEE